MLNSFRKAAGNLQLKCTFMATDISPLNSAWQLCDKQFLVKSIKDDGYINQLLDIVKQNNINLIVPTIDLDLMKLAEAKTEFEQLGCKVLISNPEVIGICQDKLKTYDFLVENGFDTPVTMSAEQAEKVKLDWPCFIKPKNGYASRGNFVVKNAQELQFYAGRVPDCIVQEFIDAPEYTCDAYVDFNGDVRCVVPRKRLFVRAGEVNKAKIVKDADIMAAVAGLVQKLSAGVGVITVQLFLTESGQIKIIEINPRFGGGAPLSIKAGADFPKWILKELSGQNCDISFDGFEDKLVMLRYDSEVWVRDN